MVGVEIDFVVVDSLAAIATYQQVFQVEVVEQTAFERGQNEVVFTLYGTRFHLLDENPEFHLNAPKEGQSSSTWFNILVEDIKATYTKAKASGFTVLQELTELKEMGVSNAVLLDPYGHVWMLHQIHTIVSFEDRVKYFEDQMA